MGRPRKRQVLTDNRSQLIIAYIRVSTAKQVESGLGLEAQETALRAELVRLGVDPDDGTRVLWLIEDGKSAKTMNRPMMRHARQLLASGQAGTLLATKIDRVSRSLVDFIDLMAACEREGWRLVLTTLQLDTSSAMGRFVARLIAEIAELEREMIAERTSEALQAKKLQGARLGVPDSVRVPDLVRGRIVALRNQGQTYAAICRLLESDGIPTARGKATWFPSTVQGVLDRV